MALVGILTAIDAIQKSLTDQFSLMGANTFTDPSGGAGFVPFLADSIITLVLAAMLISKPVEIIRESIIELAIGKLQDEDQYNECDLVVREECAPEFAVDRLYMSKTGSRYLAVALVRPADGSSQVSLDALQERKQGILDRLRPDLPHLMLELVPARFLALKRTAPCEGVRSRSISICIRTVSMTY
ncbi:MAG: hypothetical protein R6W94_08625 [Spirochaetia bacterium]